MSFWNLLTRGKSVNSNDTAGRLFALWCGYKLATRNDNVIIDKSSKISPEAKICPRNSSIEIGKNCSISPGAIIQGNVKMGHDSSVQIYSVIVGYGKVGDKEGLIDIGNHVRIAPHVMMIAANHIFEDPDIPIHRQGLKYSPITIEDNVWIGGRVNVMAGVKVGADSVIGAGAVVTNDIPPHSVAVGVPAKVIKKCK